MPGSRSSHKNSGKPARKLLFSEALLQKKGPPPTPAKQPPATHHDMTDPGIHYGLYPPGNFGSWRQIGGDG
ncbi:hypothetical protein NDU88_008175 [Pleurodeles waltl]|uniref:Uncharacterized protein n=1 Tax=Pleurodeles waltl TaxID=8319 RepID=A0AAV7VSF9_PLEWA|nr:hypothetical protein NDU88_008175 [Pleurodeles waltl]